jgi:hypothetical protein
MKGWKRPEVILSLAHVGGRYANAPCGIFRGRRWAKLFGHSGSRTETSKSTTVVSICQSSVSRTVSGQPRSCSLGIGFAFCNPSQRIVHGIETLLRPTQPSALIPALDSFIGACGKLDDCPCTYDKYQILHTNISSCLVNSSFDAKVQANSRAATRVLASEQLKRSAKL